MSFDSCNMKFLESCSSDLLPHFHCVLTLTGADQELPCLGNRRLCFLDPRTGLNGPYQVIQHCRRGFVLRQCLRALHLRNQHVHVWSGHLNWFPVCMRELLAKMSDELGREGMNILAEFSLQLWRVDG